MKIAFFSDCYLDLTGGIVSSINAQKVALESLGHTVYVFSSSYPKTAEVRKDLAKKNIFPVPSCRWCFRGATPVSRRPKIIEKWLLRKHPEIKDFDIFYIHYESGCSIAGLRLGKRLRIPTVQVMHGREDMGEANIIPFGFRTLVAFALNWFHSWYIPHPIKIRRDKYLADKVSKAKMWTLMVNHANYADLVLTPSHHFRKKLIHYGVKKKICVFPNGYPDDKFPENPLVKEYHLGEILKMIWHSRVSGEKRILPFLETLKHLDGKYQLDVYGDGPDYKKAIAYSERNRLNVVFHGAVEFAKLTDVIRGSHLDILVSYNFDTFGMTLIEAEAFGVPVFFCDPDMSEIVPAGSYIKSLEPTPDKMASALNKLFVQPDQIRQMSEIMLAHREEILISRRIKALEELFEKIKQ